MLAGAVRLHKKPIPGISLELLHQSLFATMLPSWFDIAISLRTALIKTYKIIQQYSGLATIDQWIQASNTAQPGTYGCKGGYLYEFWLFMCAGKELHKYISKLVHSDTLFGDDTLKRIETDTKQQWYIWILKATHDISQKNTEQAFQLSLALQWKGLSTTGLELLGQGRVSCTKRTHKNKLTQLVEQQAIASKQHLQQPHIIWVDNFAKFIANPFYRLNIGAFREANYTALGISHPDNMDHLDTDVVYDINGKIIPANTVAIFDANSLRDITTALSYYNNYSHVHFYTRSKCVRDKLLIFPTTPDTVVANNEISSIHGLKNFHPTEMVNADIGGNSGLMQVLQRVQDLTSREEGEQYIHLVVDVGIYWRVMKVCITIYIPPVLTLYAAYLLTLHPNQGLQREMVCCFGQMAPQQRNS